METQTEQKQTLKQVEKMFIEEMKAKTKEEIRTAKDFAGMSYNEIEGNEE